MHSLLASPVCLQIQKPVVNTNVETLAQELEELARTQVRGDQGPHWAGRGQREVWEVGEVGWLGLGRVMKAKAGDGGVPTRERRGPGFPGWA